MKPQFAVGDAVICKKSHPQSRGDVPGVPYWNSAMDKHVGQIGHVTKVGTFISVYFEGQTYAGDWQFDWSWLEHAAETEDEMSTPAVTDKATATAKETFTTTWSLDITLTDGKVTAVNVHPPAEPKVKPKAEPKFKVGDIVVCKAKAKQMPTSHAWTSDMTLLLNVPGRVSSIESKYKIVYVEFGGYNTHWGYPEDCLEHETSEMAAAMNQLFARLDEAKKTITIGRSDTKFI